MTKSQFDKAIRLAQSVADLPPWLELDKFMGCALPQFRPVYCTLREAASFIRYQCLMFNGEMEGTSLDQMARIARRKFIVVGE